MSEERPMGDKERKKALQNAVKPLSHDESVEIPEIKQIDNRASGTPEMKYQYFDLCQLAKYPNIEIKLDGIDAQVFFDGNQVDSFDVREVIESIVSKNILTIEQVKKRNATIERRKQKREQKK